MIQAEIETVKKMTTTVVGQMLQLLVKVMVGLSLRKHLTILVQIAVAPVFNAIQARQSRHLQILIPIGTQENTVAVLCATLLWDKAKRY